MRKSLTYNIEYNEDGAYGVIPVTVSFISRAVIKEYGEIESLKYEMTMLYSDFKKVQTEMESAKDNNVDEVELSAMLKKCMSLVQEMKTPRFQELPKRRFDLICKILKQNGYIEGKLLQFEYWEDCIDPAAEIEFLNTAVNKDVEKKK